MARTSARLAWEWTTSFGLTGMKDLLYPVYYTALRPFERLTDPGVNVYDLEWDLLVVLDACRADLMVEAVEEGQLPNVETAADPAVDSYRSVGSMTRDWMARTFTDDRREQVAETAYVCANPFSAEVLDPADFARLDEVWREAWTEPGTVPPRAVTDRVVDLVRRERPERTIAHYLQPHCPFIDRPELSRGKELDRFGASHWPDVWERYRMGHLDLEALWDGYRSNLERGLAELSILLRNVEAETVLVSSDHGNGIGEAGVYGHPPGQWIDAVREVPLVRTSATDTGEHEPAVDDTQAADAVEDRLRALGYAG